MGAKILCATSYPTHETRGWCGQRFFLGTRFGAKQASNRGIGLLGFGVLALYTTSHLNCSLTRGKMWHNRFICNLHKIVSTSKWHFFFLLHPAVLYPAGFLLLNGTSSFFCILLFCILLGGLAQPRAADFLPPQQCVRAPPKCKNSAMCTIPFREAAWGDGDRPRRRYSLGAGSGLWSSIDSANNTNISWKRHRMPQPTPKS